MDISWVLREETTVRDVILVSLFEFRRQISVEEIEFFK